MERKNRRLFLNKEHELYLVEEAIPEPAENEVLIQIAANGICGSDIHFFHEGGWETSWWIRLMCLVMKPAERS